MGRNNMTWEAVRRAAALFSALKVYGINYVVDLSIADAETSSA